MLNLITFVIDSHTQILITVTFSALIIPKLSDSHLKNHENIYFIFSERLLDSNDLLNEMIIILFLNSKGDRLNI